VFTSVALNMANGPAWCSPLNGVTSSGAPLQAASSGLLNQHRSEYPIDTKPVRSDQRRRRDRPILITDSGAKLQLEWVLYVSLPLMPWDSCEAAPLKYQRDDE